MGRSNSENVLKRLLARRIKLNQTWEEVSMASGIPVGTLNRWLYVRVPGHFNEDTLAKIAAYLDVEPESLQAEKPVRKTKLDLRKERPVLILRSELRALIREEVRAGVRAELEGGELEGGSQ